jgi:hypothetical protein
MASVHQPETYEPPKIEGRAAINAPLVQTAGSLPAFSAAFRPSSLYTPPRIVERTPVDVPLVAFGSGPLPDACAFFRPTSI